MLLRTLVLPGMWLRILMLSGMLLRILILSGMDTDAVWCVSQKSV